MNYAKESDAKEFIIGTEISIAEHLQYECPDKNFYGLTLKLICPNMNQQHLLMFTTALTATAEKKSSLTIRLSQTQESALTK